MKNFRIIALFFALFALVLAGCSSDDGGSTSDGNYTSNPEVVEVLGSCIGFLKAEKWDEAVQCYDNAYDKDNNDPSAIIYSTLANLAKISIDPKVVALIKDNFGFKKYPNKLNALFSDSWFEDYDDESLPSIETPNWIKGEGSAYSTAFGADAWALSLIANLIDKNTSGLNSLMDEVVDGVFGASYNKAAERIKKLESRQNARISLDPYFIEQLDLEDLFDEYDKIGWAEVNVVTSAMLLMKASLEWVQSYNLDNNLNPVKYTWKDDIDDILNHFKAMEANDLPFNNNFFKARSGKMANSKADFIKAIEGLQASYTSIQNSDLYSGKAKESYKTINSGFSEMLKAIKNGSKFYIPEDDPTEINSWPTKDGNDVAATIDFGNFFTEGYLSLQNIFETEGGKPLFYMHGEKLTKANYEDFIDYGDNLELKLNISHIKGLIGSDEIDEFKFLDIDLDGDAAKVLFEKYY